MTLEFEVTPEQQAMLDDPAHTKIWACGRRWGKSLLMAIAMIIAAVTHPGCMVWYVSPRYARSMRMMRMMEKAEGFQSIGMEPKRQFPPRFELSNGSEIWFISGDREQELRGEGLRLACFDEASIQSQTLYEAVLMPMLADSGGTMIVASTFNGRNWFYNLCVNSMAGNEYARTICTGNDSDIKTWIYPSSTGYAFTGSPEKLANLERLKAVTGSMTWKQEYECEPLAMVDAVFYYVDQCVTQAITGPFPIKPERGMEYVVAQDIGKDVDPSGVVVEELKSGKVIHVEIYPLHTPHKQQAARTVQLAEHFNNALVCLDTTGGGEGGNREPFIEEYQKTIKYFESVTFTIDTKRAMVRLLSLELENKRTEIPANFIELISQLKLYRYKLGETAIQPIFYGRPDDLVAAKMMCAWARKKGWKPPRTGNSIYGLGTI